MHLAGQGIMNQRSYHIIIFHLSISALKFNRGVGLRPVDGVPPCLFVRKCWKAATGFEPVSRGFADRSLGPLGYAAEHMDVSEVT